MLTTQTKTLKTFPGMLKNLGFIRTFSRSLIGGQITFSLLRVLE